MGDTSNPEMDIHCGVLEKQDIAVIRVFGRGNFANSVPFKQFADHLQSQGRPKKFVTDLGHCETMDSTFMGVLASVSIAQSKGGRDRVVVIHANQHCRRLLKTLGLVHLLEVHESAGGQEDAVKEAEKSMAPAENNPVSRIEQLCITLDAHKTLVKLDEENELRFQSVIHYLEHSLENAKQGKEDAL